MKAVDIIILSMLILVFVTGCTPQKDVSTSEDLETYKDTYCLSFCIGQENYKSDKYDSENCYCLDDVGNIINQTSIPTDASLYPDWND